MKKKLMSLMLALVLLITPLSGVMNRHVHASDGFFCEFCGEWKEDCAMCFNCYICEDCASDYCQECLACLLCAQELEFHCPSCGETCVDPEYGDYPHCESCRICEDCAELIDTPMGLLCEECLQEMDENEFNILCPNCETNVIGSTFDENAPMDDNLGECGEHCVECYENFLCGECGECTLCSGAELCEYCGICADCAISDGYHCPDCGACYSDAGQCPEGAEHCVNCCENICESCETCTRGAEIEYCEECHLCENCWEHCPLCEECYEVVGRCEDSGEHCIECCMSEEWLCGQCDRCTEALGLEICEYCGLCEDCCRENREYYGVDRCILDEETKPEELDVSKHDENHHILRYTSSSDECHDVWCAFPGCDYYISDSTPHVFIWRTLEHPTLTKEGKRKGTCIYCGDVTEETVPKIVPPEYCFVEQPKDIEVLPNKKKIDFYVSIGEVGSETPPSWGFYTQISAIPVIDGEELPKTVKELMNNCYHTEIRNYRYWLNDMTYEAGTGVFPCTIYGKSGTGNGKFAGFTAQGKKLTWRLAVYDVRGEKVTYSEPFTIDWNAKHNQHTCVWVSGKISKRDEKIYFDKDYSASALKFYDGTYHWQECSVCGARLTIPMKHRYVLESKYGDCKSATGHYVCKDCGHSIDIFLGGSYLPHTYSDDYKFSGDKHWQYCTVCGVVEKQEPHNLKEYVFSDCTKTVKTIVCEDCGYAHIEHDSGKGHKYTNDGDFNGWYGDRTKHWKICTVCGEVKEAEHKYVNGACEVCGIDLPQFAIVGSFCTHNTLLTIEKKDELTPEDEALFNAGNWNGTWIDEISGDTVGLGKTYELTDDDLGRCLRVEIQLFNGSDYNAYMEQDIECKYIDVAGYPATCAAEGMLDHQVCLKCNRNCIGGKPVDNVIIPKLTEHTYDNSCDAVCNVCGNVREITHQWEEAYICSPEGHCHKCSVCGAISGTAPHSYTITWSKYADCENDGICGMQCECGYYEEKVEPATGHSWIHADAIPGLCIYDGVDEHYYCENCYAMAKDAEGKEKVGIKKILLPIDPNNHVGSDLIGFNEKEHYTICECGAHIDNAEHTFDASGRCTVCHYKKGSNVKTSVLDLTKHDAVHANCITPGTKTYYTDKDGKIYLSPVGVIAVSAEDLVMPVSTVNHVGGEYAHTSTEHWIACACGAELRKTEHSFDEKNVCTVCGYESKKSGNDPANPSGNGGGKVSGFPWWIFIIIGVVVAGAAVVVIIIVRKKKETAK